ncbi:MAG: hypothetical protein ACP5O7_09885 [Phycisphaerae bacterium]
MPPAEIAGEAFMAEAIGHGNFSGRPGIMPILLAFPVAFAGYKALAACLVLKRNAESYTRADADKMSALPAQPADCPEKLPRPLPFMKNRRFDSMPSSRYSL